MISKLIKKNRGFSLIEMLVSFVIITTSMAAIFSLIVQNIQAQKVNKDFLVASMLAQEGLELVRSIRDENWLDPLNPGVWDAIDEVDNTFSIDFDFNIDRVPNVVSDAGARLSLDGSGFYWHGAGTATQFYRLITVAPSADDTDGDGYADYVSVSSNVQWTINGDTKNYVAETLLYDWR